MRRGSEFSNSTLDTRASTIAPAASPKQSLDLTNLTEKETAEQYQLTKAGEFNKRELSIEPLALNQANALNESVRSDNARMIKLKLNKTNTMEKRECCAIS